MMDMLKSTWVATLLSIWLRVTSWSLGLWIWVQHWVNSRPASGEQESPLWVSTSPTSGEPRFSLSLSLFPPSSLSLFPSWDSLSLSLPLAHLCPLSQKKKKIKKCFRKRVEFLGESFMCLQHYSLILKRFSKWLYEFKPFLLSLPLPAADLILVIHSIEWL